MDSETALRGLPPSLSQALADHDGPLWGQLLASGVLAPRTLQCAVVAACAVQWASGLISASNCATNLGLVPAEAMELAEHRRYRSQILDLRNLRNLRRSRSRSGGDPLTVRARRLMLLPADASLVRLPADLRQDLLQSAPVPREAGGASEEHRCYEDAMAEEAEFIADAMAEGDEFFADAIEAVWRLGRDLRPPFDGALHRLQASGRLLRCLLLEPRLAIHLRLFMRHDDVGETAREALCALVRPGRLLDGLALSSHADAELALAETVRHRMVGIELRGYDESSWGLCAKIIALLGRAPSPGLLFAKGPEEGPSDAVTCRGLARPLQLAAALGDTRALRVAARGPLAAHAAAAQLQLGLIAEWALLMGACAALEGASLPPAGASSEGAPLTGACAALEGASPPPAGASSEGEPVAIRVLREMVVRRTRLLFIEARRRLEEEEPSLCVRDSVLEWASRA